MDKLGLNINFSAVFGILVVVALLRVIMAPFPNIEPIMLFTITTALVLGPVSGFLFGFGSMIFSDLYLGLGIWSIYTSLTYGLIGILCGIFGILKRNWSRFELTLLAFFMTLLYDIITATFWAFQTMQPLPLVYTLQIPFTFLHLSNCIFAFLFAPSLIRLSMRAKRFSVSRFMRRVFTYT